MASWYLYTVLAVGVTIVIGGVLLFRLHAFLALILAALVVAALTPPVAVERTQLLAKGVQVVAVDSSQGTITLANSGGGWKFSPDSPYRILRDADGTKRLGDVGTIRLEAVLSADAASQTFSAAPSDRNQLSTIQRGDLLVAAPDRQAAATASQRNIGARVAQDFGATCTQIAILIAMASIVGKCLLDSGAADRIVRSALAVVGERGAPVAFAGSGFVLGIPVFFDTVFYLMIPLGKATRLRTGRNYLLYVLAIVCGGTMSHSLIPPTPGPLFVAEAMEINLGVMIAVGCVIGLVASAAGITFAYVLNQYWDLPLRDSADMSLGDLENLAARNLHQLPPLWLSLAPILLPVLLIAGDTVLDTGIGIGAVVVSQETAWVAVVEHDGQTVIAMSERARSVAATLGDKNVALVLSALVAILTLVVKTRPTKDRFAAAMQGAVASAGTIILITAAGGAFGGALKQTGVAELIGRPESNSQVAYLLMGFAITAAIRTAQGSATVAMITSVGILGPLAASGELGFHPVYLAMAIGCGSKPVSWMNDSGFWVICKMSGMTEMEGLKSVTPLTLVMGLAGLAATILGATFFPLV